MPFFITTSVMVSDFRHIDFQDKLLHGQILVTFTAFVTKIMICIVCGWFSNLSMFDALALAAIMCSKGIIDISSFIIFHESKVCISNSLRT